MKVFTRALSFCIVDEVDSILLDESNQPLIFASPVDDAAVRSRLSLSNMVRGMLGPDMIDVPRQGPPLPSALAGSPPCIAPMTKPLHFSGRNAARWLET